LGCQFELSINFLVFIPVAKPHSLKISLQGGKNAWKQIATIALTVVTAVLEEQTKKK